MPADGPLPDHRGMPPRALLRHEPPPTRPEPPPAGALSDSLAALPGVGQFKADRVLARFPSVAALADASAGQISSLPGLGVTSAERILAWARDVAGTPTGQRATPAADRSHSAQALPLCLALADLHGVGLRRAARIISRCPDLPSLAAADIDDLSTLDRVGITTATVAVQWARTRVAAGQRDFGPPAEWVHHLLAALPDLRAVDPQAVLVRFVTTEELYTARVADLEAVRGIGTATAERVVAFLDTIRPKPHTASPAQPEPVPASMDVTATLTSAGVDDTGADLLSDLLVHRAHLADLPDPADLDRLPADLEGLMAAVRNWARLGPTSKTPAEPDPQDANAPDLAEADTAVDDEPLPDLAPGRCGPCRMLLRPTRKHGRAAGIAGRCACQICTDALLTAKDVIASRIAGDTLQAIGDRLGVSREWVRNVADRIAPHDPAGAVTTERRRLQQEVASIPPMHACRMCGQRNRTVYCNDDHRDMHLSLRWHINADYRTNHTKSIASWVIANADAVNDAALTHAQRRLDGSAQPGQSSWLVTGSIAWRSVRSAIEGNWPILEVLPVHLVDQVRNDLDAGHEDRADPTVALDMILNGHSIDAVAAHLGVANATIGLWIDRATSDADPVSPDTTTMMLRMFRRGTRLRAIADIHNLDPWAVRGALADVGVHGSEFDDASRDRVATAMRMAADGHSTSEIARATGAQHATVDRWIGHTQPQPTPPPSTNNHP